MRTKITGPVSPPRQPRLLDRMVPLPQVITKVMKRHWEGVRALHNEDLESGFGRVYLPMALSRKYPTADREWGWQWVFPSYKRSLDPRSRIERRHHVSQDMIFKAVKGAILPHVQALSGINPKHRQHQYCNH